MKLLEEKVAIVTGGSRGIGKAIVQEFVDQGAKVVFTYLSSEKDAKNLEKELNLSSEVLAVKSDASDVEQAQELLKTTLDSFGKVDIVVNNAGVTKDNLLLRMSKDDWDWVHKINLDSVFNLTKAAMRPMMKQRSGSVINISSVVGIKGNAGQANYASTKAGIIGFSKSVALELGSRNIRCNVVAPGFIETEMTEKLDQNMVDQWKKAIPLQRGGSGKDVAQSVVFLASDMSTYISGQVIQVDGGMLT